MATTYLTRTGVTPTISNKYTFSCWVKRGSIGTTETIFRTYSDSNNSAQLIFDSDDSFAFQDIIGGTTVTNLKPSNLFRDPGAWMNIIVQVDYTQATAADRAKIFINGVEVSYSATTVQSEGGASMLNTANNNALGSNRSNSSHYFTGSMSQVNFIDGTAYPATAFGSVNATSGIWVANSGPTVTYGNNGFFLDMANSSDMGNDVSGKTNDFTVGGGTVTQMEDTPDNNFATLNPLYVINASEMPTLTNGNTTGTSTSSGYNSGVASIAPAGSGKYYSEHKLISGTGGWATNTYLGYNQTPSASPTSAPHDTNFFYGVLADGGAREGATNKAGYAGTWTSGDIIQLALDLDNNRLYVGKNGLWADGSGNWDEANINAYINLAASPAVAGENWFMMCGDKNTSTATWGNNFGNGHFGTTAVTTNSGNGYAGAEGKSIFNYQPPTGYSALSTKGLNL